MGESTAAQRTTNPGSKGVEFVVPKKGGVEFVDEKAPKTTKAEEAREIVAASGGIVEIQIPDATSPRHIETSSAHEALVEEMGDSKVEVLPQNVVEEENPSNVSTGEEQAFNEILEQGFLDEEKEGPTAKPGTIEELSELLKNASRDMVKVFNEGSYGKKVKDFMKLALTDLAERVQNLFDQRKNMQPDEVTEQIKKLSSEIATVGTEEWMKRFTTVGGENDVDTQLVNKLLINEEVKNQETVAAEVEARFQKDFVLAEEDLKNIVAEVDMPEGKKTVRFSNLSQGQQLLLLENLKSFSLDNAKEQALKRYVEGEKEKYSNSGLIKKAWLGATKTFRRTHDISATERHLLLNPEESKEMYKEVLQEMLVMAACAPEAEWKEGKLQVNFAIEKDFEGLDVQKLGVVEKLKNFNDVAGKFTRIPPEYAYGKDEKKLAEYEEAKKAYVEARGLLLSLKATPGNEDDALEYVANLDKKIHFSQLFNTDSKTEAAFAEIINKKYANLEGMKAFLRERSRLMMGGTAIRTIGMVGAAEVALGFGASVAGAPILAALGLGAGIGAVTGGKIGKYMALKRARQEIADKKELGKMGVTDAGNEKDFRAAAETKIITSKEGGGQEIGVGLADKLEYALTRVEEADDAVNADKKQRMLDVLADRAYYTEQKIKEGLVNFGEGSAGFKNRYELNLALAKARVLFEMSEPELERKINVKIEEMMKETKTVKIIKKTDAEKIVDVKGKIDALLGRQTEKIHEQDEEHKRKMAKQALKRGIFLGAVFGGGAAEAGHLLHEWRYGGNGVEGSLAQRVGVGHIDTAPPKMPLPDEMLQSSRHEPVTAPIKVNKYPPPVETGTLTEKLPSGQIVEPVTGIPDTTPETGVMPPDVPDMQQTIDEIGTEAQNTVGGKEFGGGWELQGRQTAIEATMKELGQTHVVTAHDTHGIWGIIKEKLNNNTEFQNLDPRQKNIVIDSLKDRVTNLSPEKLKEIGIKSGNADKIYPGNELKLDKIFNDSKELIRAFNRAEHVGMTDKTLQTSVHEPVTAPIKVNKYPPPVETGTLTEKLPSGQIVEPVTGIPDTTPETGVMPPDVPDMQQTIDEIGTEALHTTNEAINPPMSIVPTGEAFLVSPRSVPRHYYDVAYETVHREHPELPLSFYNQNIKDYLAEHPDGRMELDRIFSVDGVNNPKDLPADNDLVLTYFARKSWQRDIEINTFKMNGNFIPTRYRDQAVHDLSVSHPEAPREFYARQMEELLSSDEFAKKRYDEFLRDAHRASQEIGMPLPEKFGYSPDDTVEDYYARMQEWRAQFSESFPKNFPDLYSNKYFMRPSTDD